MATTTDPLQQSGYNDAMSSATTSVDHARQASQLTTTSAAKRSATIPSDVVRLDALLTSGQRKFFDFQPTTSIRNVRDTIWNEWPQDWPPRPSSSSAIRILHLGHILDEKAVLSTSSSAAPSTTAGTMPLGKTTVVHLLVRPSQSKKSDADDEEPLKKTRRDDINAGCCSCVVM